MSRCFPYPPSGFARPARSEAERIDILEKEKHKAKKHRKDHKEKERREGKEKRDKHRSKEKHKEKHDRKDKDKKKHKDRHKDKTRTPEQPAGKIKKAQHEERCRGSSQRTEEVDQSKFTRELGRRIRDEEKGAANQLVQNFGHCLQRGLEKSGATAAFGDGLAVNKISPNSVNVVQQRTEKMGKQANNGTMSTQRRTNHPGSGTAMQKETSTTDQLVTGLNSSRERGNSVKGTKVENSSGSAQRISVGQSTGEESDPANGIMSSKIYTLQRPNDGKGHSATSFPSFCNGKIERMDPAITMQMEEENISKPLTNHHFLGHAKNDGIAQHTNSVIKKSNIREKDQHKHKEKDELAESTRKSKPTPLQKGAKKIAGADENTKKRKDSEMNGFLHEHNVRPSKIPRTNSCLPVEGDRILQQFHSLPSSIRPCGMISDKIKTERLLLDSNEQMRLSIEEAQYSPADLRLPDLVTCENGEDFKRSPHPDEKYLSRVYSVPKMDEWQDFDDQDWLYKDCRVRSKPKTGIGVNETLFVWVKAIHIVSADIIALPYVIPF